MINRNTEYGFQFGAATIERHWSTAEGRAVIQIKTARATLDIYVTPTGFVRIFDRKKGELKPPDKSAPTLA